MVALDLLIIGLAVTLEPIPLTAFILVLSTDRGPRNGAWFIAGWILSLAVIVAAVVLITGGKPPAPSSEPSTAVLSIKILLGTALVLFGVWRLRHSGRPRKAPSWMAKLDHLSGWTAAGLGILIQPWPLVAAGAATVAQLHVATVADYLLLIAFCLLCTASYGALEIHVLLAPELAHQRLEGIRSWIDTHRDQAIVVLSLLVGFWLIADSSYLIAS